MTPPSAARKRVLPAVGTGFAIDKVRFLSWGDCHPADLARQGEGWEGGVGENGKLYLRSEEMNLTFMRHERGTLFLDGSALSFASWLEGRSSRANVIPPRGISGARMEDVLRLMVLRSVPATAIAHLRDGTRQSGWAWHAKNAEGRKGDLPPRGRRLSRWFAINNLEVCADVFTTDCMPVIEAAKFLQGRGKKTDYPTTAYLSGFRRWLAAAGRSVNLDVHPHLLRHSIAVALLRGGADLRHLQEFLGHSDLETTRIYMRLHPGQLRDAYDRAMPALAEVNEPAEGEAGVPPRS